MSDDLDARLEEVKQRQAERDDLQARLATVKEDLVKTGYEFALADAELADVAAELEALESLTPKAMLSGLLGRRQGQLNEKRDRAAELEQRVNELAERVVGLDQKLQEVESKLEPYADVDATYKSLLARKRSELALAGGGADSELEAAAGALAAARNELHKLNKTIQSGKHVLERLESMGRSLNRARSKSLASTSIGALPATAINAVMAAGAKGSVNRVKEGFVRFHEQLNELDLSTDDAFHDEIRRLVIEVGTLCAEVGDQSTLGMMWSTETVHKYEDEVDMLVGHLKDKAKDVTKQVTALESEQQTAIESA